MLNLKDDIDRKGNFKRLGKFCIFLFRIYFKMLSLY